ncbi:MAG: HD domain-containing protein [Candidatus Aenigmarchaeota archaeon]|nr:HD domain-containing protein [Candidatus Aenigmarchaeota archaeon]
MDIEKVKEIARKYYDSNDPMHGWDHIIRVYNLCMNIGKKEGADLEVLGLAALLHDIGISRGRDNHEKTGAVMAEEILKDYKDEERKKNVIHCIESHRFSKGIKPRTLEAEILQDADRLDAIGAIGIVRAMVHSGYFRRPIYIPDKKISMNYNGKSETAIDHFYEKLLKIKDSLNTRTAREIAEHRHKFMEIFLREFFDEWDGKK